MKKTLVHLAKEVLRVCGHDEHGREIPDPTPVEMPAGFVRPPTLQEQIRAALMSAEIRRAQQERGEETLEDSMDFGETDPEDVPATVHEARVMQEEAIAFGAEEYARQERRKALQPPAPTPATPPKAPAEEPAKPG